MPTGNEVINPALKLLGVLAQGETPSASESDDARVALNTMLDGWSTEKLNVFYHAIFTNALTAAQNSYTIGSGGNFSTTRPTKIQTANAVLNSINHPIEIVDQDRWAAIQEQGATGKLPVMLFYDNNNSAGLARIMLWPTPSDATVSLQIYTWSPLPSFSDLVTNVNFNVGYLRALIFNLAIEIAPSYGAAAVQQAGMITQIAAEAKSDIRRLNAEILGGDPAAGILNNITPPPGVAA